MKKVSSYSVKILKNLICLAYSVSSRFFPKELWNPQICKRKYILSILYINSFKVSVKIFRARVHVMCMLYFGIIAFLTSVERAKMITDISVKCRAWKPKVHGSTIITNYNYILLLLSVWTPCMPGAGSQWLYGVQVVLNQLFTCCQVQVITTQGA